MFVSLVVRPFCDHFCRNWTTRATWASQNRIVQNRIEPLEQNSFSYLASRIRTEFEKNIFVTWFSLYLNTYFPPTNSVLFYFCFEYLLIYWLVLYFAKDEIFCRRCVTDCIELNVCVSPGRETHMFRSPGSRLNWSNYQVVFLCNKICSQKLVKLSVWAMQCILQP